MYFFQLQIIRLFWTAFHYSWNLQVSHRYCSITLGWRLAKIAIAGNSTSKIALNSIPLLEKLITLTSHSISNRALTSKIALSGHPISNCALTSKIGCRVQKEFPVARNERTSADRTTRSNLRSNFRPSFAITSGNNINVDNNVDNVIDNSNFCNSTTCLSEPFISISVHGWNEVKSRKNISKAISVLLEEIEIEP